MLTADQIIDRHRQLYPCSCPSMCVELLLKLHGMVGGGYYKIQNCYRNSNVGFGPFRQATIRRLRFRERLLDDVPTELPQILQEEYEAGRAPVISVFSYEKDGVGYFHEWLVISRHKTDFLLVSKNGAATIRSALRPLLARSPHANLLTYRVLET